MISAGNLFGLSGIAISTMTVRAATLVVSTVTYCVAEHPAMSIARRYRYRRR